MGQQHPGAVHPFDFPSVSSLSKLLFGPVADAGLVGGEVGGKGNAQADARRQVRIEQRPTGFEGAHTTAISGSTDQRDSRTAWFRE